MLHRLAGTPPEGYVLFHNQTWDDKDGSGRAYTRYQGPFGDRLWVHKLRFEDFLRALNLDRRLTITTGRTPNDQSLSAPRSDGSATIALTLTASARKRAKDPFRIVSAPDGYLIEIDDEQLSRAIAGLSPRVAHKKIPDLLEDHLHQAAYKLWRPQFLESTAVKLGIFLTVGAVGTFFPTMVTLLVVTSLALTYFSVYSLFKVVEQVLGETFGVLPIVMGTAYATFNLLDVMHVIVKKSDAWKDLFLRAGRLYGEAQFIRTNVGLPLHLTTHYFRHRNTPLFVLGPGSTIR